MMTLLAGVFASVGMLFGGMFGSHAITASSTPREYMHTASTSPWMQHSRNNTASSTMRVAPGILGKVDSIEGTTITVTGRDQKGDATTTYSVDASNAKFMNLHNGTASSTSSTISSVQEGESVLVVGTVSGTSVVAKTIVEGIPTHPIMHMRAAIKGMKEMHGTMQASTSASSQ